MEKNGEMWVPLFYISFIIIKYKYNDLVKCIFNFLKWKKKSKWDFKSRNDKMRWFFTDENTLFWYIGWLWFHMEYLDFKSFSTCSIYLCQYVRTAEFLFMLTRHKFEAVHGLGKLHYLLEVGIKFACSKWWKHIWSRVSNNLWIKFAHHTTTRGFLHSLTIAELSRFQLPLWTRQSLTISLRRFISM